MAAMSGRVWSITVGVVLAIACAGAASRINPKTVGSSVDGPYFRSGFENGTLLGPIEDCHSVECYESILGKDNPNGIAWPPNIWGSGKSSYRQGGWFQLLADTSPLTPSTVTNFLHAELVVMPGHSGAESQALYLRNDGGNVGCPSCRTYQGKGGARQLVYIVAPEADAATAQGDFYLRYWLYLQPDLARRVIVGRQPDGSAGDWRVIMELKTGGGLRSGNGRCIETSPSVYGGDFRMVVDIIHDAGGLFWRMAADNNANGGEPLMQFWELNDHAGPTQLPRNRIPLGRWFEVEWFVHRDAEGGRAWFAADGKVIFDKRGGIFFGDHHCPINRIVPFEVYTGGFYPQEEWVDDFELWGEFPADASRPH